MEKLSRSDVLRKCIVVFDAIRRATSKGNAGLEPVPGSELSFRVDSEICDTLREMLREMEEGTVRDTPERLADWQRDVIENGGPERSLRLV